MEKLRKIEYYISDKYDPQAGFMDGGDENDSKTTMNDKPSVMKTVIIEDEKTGEISCIECKRIIRFVNE